MDKRNSPERGGMGNFDAIRNEIEDGINAADTAGFEPDFAHIWESEAFQALSSKEQETLKEWAAHKAAGGTDSARADAPETAEAPAQDAASTDDTESTPPDSEQSLVDLLRDTERPPKGNLKSRQFHNYHYERDDAGQLYIEEKFGKLDRRGDGYDDKLVATTIKIPGSLRDGVENNANVADEVLEVCSGLRKELDEPKEGLKFFVDVRKVDPDFRFIKWKYRLDGEKLFEPIDPKSLPEGIAALIQADPSHYHRAKEFRDWYGVTLQRKREEIISRRLARKLGNEDERAETYQKAVSQRAPADSSAPDAPPVAPPADDGKPSKWDRDDSAKDAAKDALKPVHRDAIAPPGFIPRVEGIETKQLHDLLAVRAEIVAMQSEHLFALPEKTKELVDYVTRVTANLFVLDYKNALTEETVRTAVHEALVKRYGDRDDVKRSLESLMDAPAPTLVEVKKEAEEETEAVAEEEWAEVKDDDLIEDDGSPATKAVVVEQEAGDDALSQEIAAAREALRDDLDRVSSPEEFESFVKLLREIAAGNQADAAAAAESLLADAEAGVAGPFSETWREGLTRTEAEKELFKTHPHLDARNIRMNAEGKVIAHIEKREDDASLRRAARRLVNDALADKGFDDEGIAEEIANLVVNIAKGRAKNAKMQQDFSASFAALNAEGDEYTVKRLEMLAEVLSGIAQDRLDERTKKQ